MLSSSSYWIIVFWTLCLLTLAGFNALWSAKFFKLSGTSDPMAPAFLLLHIAYLNMFTCYTAIRALPLFDIDPNQNVIIVTWGTLSTAGVILAYLILQGRIKELAQPAKRKTKEGYDPL